MIKATVLLFSPEGKLSGSQVVQDVEAFVKRVYQATQDANAQQKAEQFVVDLLNECCPVIVHPFNGSRFEFLTEEVEA